MPDTGRWAKTCPNCGHRITWTGSIGSPPPCPKCNPKPRNATRPPDKAWGTNGGAGSPRIVTPADVADEALRDGALELCEYVLEKIEELPSRASEFGESAAETIKSIAETIESRGYATAGQVQAVKNIERGVEKWFAY